MASSLPQDSPLPLDSLQPPDSPPPPEIPATPASPPPPEDPPVPAGIFSLDLIHNDTIQELFTHMPLETICRAQYTNRRMFELLTSPSFEKWHDKTSIRLNMGFNIIVCREDESKSIPWHRFVENYVGGNLRDVFNGDYGGRIMNGYQWMDVQGISTSHGVVCVTLEDESIYLYHTMVQRTYWAPIPPSLENWTSCGYHLGFNEILGSFVVVNILRDPHHNIRTLIWRCAMSGDENDVEQWVEMDLDRLVYMGSSGRRSVSIGNELLFIVDEPAREQKPTLKSTKKLIWALDVVVFTSRLIQLPLESVSLVTYEWP